MTEITDENFNISVMLLEKTPDYNGRYFCAVSFHVATQNHTYPQTCLLDFLDLEYILDLLEEPKEYAFNGGRVYDPSDEE